MGPLSETKATLRFFGEALDPDEITRLLGKEPTSTGRKGQVIQRPAREDRVLRQGSWRLTVAGAIPGDLDDQIAQLLAGTTTDLSVWKQLSEKFRGNVFCGLFMEDINEGISISPSTLASMGERGLVLDLDIYGKGDEL